MSINIAAIQQAWSDAFNVFWELDGFTTADIISVSSTGGNRALGQAPTVTETTATGIACLMFSFSRPGLFVTKELFPDGRLPEGQRGFVFRQSVTVDNILRFPSTTGDRYKVISVLYIYQSAEYLAICEIEAA